MLRHSEKVTHSLRWHESWGQPLDSDMGTIQSLSQRWRQKRVENVERQRGREAEREREEEREIYITDLVLFPTGKTKINSMLEK